VGLRHYSDEIDTVPFSYTEAGQGETIILIPGTLGDEYLFEKIQQALADHFRVLVFDHLDLVSLHEVVHTFHQIFTEILGLSSFHVGGTSVGGWIAQHYTMTYPDMVQSLIIGNSFSDNTHLRHQSLRIYKISRFIPWFIFRRVFEKNIRTSLVDYDPQITRYFIQSLHDMGKTTLRRRLWWSLTPLPELNLDGQIPKLIIYTKDDSVVSYDITQELIAHYPEAEVAEIETGNHYPYQTNPSAYIDTLSSFFDQIT